MKKLKVLLSVLLSAMLVLSMAAPAFATQQGDLTGGKITISNTVVGQTYEIYQILYLESFDAGDPDNEDNPIAPKGAYKVNAAWEDFFATSGAGFKYITKEDGEYIKWKDGQDIEKFVEEAKAYIDTKNADEIPEANRLKPDGSIKKTAENQEVVFNNLKLGWYLVDSTLGTLCSIDTTKKEVTINEKNAKPTIDKTVQEDSTGAFGADNTAQIGQDVNFKITVGARKGAQGYIVRDIMDAGLSFNDDIQIVAGSQTLTKGTHYTVALDEATYTFVITFVQDYLDTITGNTDIVITYSATLNDDAEIDDANNNTANNNTASLVYGENPDVITDYTETFTYEVDIVKDNEQDELLSGAEFKLYNKNNELMELVDNGSGVYTVYDTVSQVAAGKKVNVLIVPASGVIVIKGLDAGDTYYLEEIKAPDGYNKLTGKKDFILTESAKATIAEGSYVSGGIEIENKAGTLLPETGGTGTKVLFTVGGIMMVVAFVLITSKRRMAAEK